MVQFKQKSLATSPCPIYLWMRYIDDTCAILRMYDVDTFLNLISAQDLNIKSTIEGEQEGNISMSTNHFLSLCTEKQPILSISKLQVKSSARTHKRSVVRTLLHCEWISIVGYQHPMQSKSRQEQTMTSESSVLNICCEYQFSLSQ